MMFIFQERLANEKRQCLKVSRRWSIDPTVARIISISFTSVVADGSKTIGKERYHAMCKRCVLESATNPNIVDSLAPEWFDVIDADHDGRVCLDDILRWYTKLTLHQPNLMETVKEDEIEGDGRALPRVGASYFERQASVHSESTEPSPQKGEAQNAATTPSDGEGVAGLARLNTQMSVRIDAAEGDSEGGVPHQERTSISRWLLSNTTLDGSEGVVVASNMEVTEGDRTSEQAVDSPSVARGSLRDVQLYRQQQDDIAVEIRLSTAATEEVATREQRGFRKSVKLEVGRKSTLKPGQRKLLDGIIGGFMAPRPQSIEGKPVLKRKSGAFKPFGKVGAGRRSVNSRPSLYKA